MTRIGIDARMIRITGIGRYTEELVSALVRQGVFPTVFVSPVDAAWWHLRHPSVPYRISSEPIYSWSEQLVFPARLAKENFDLVHFTNFNVPLSYRGPFVVTIHDTIPLHYAGERRRSGLTRQAYQRVLKSAIERAERVIVPTIAVRNELSELTDVSKVVVVRHGLSEHFTGPVSSAAEAGRVFSRLGIEGPYLLVVGNDRSHKNIEGVLEALALARGTFADMRLVIAGPRSTTRRELINGMVQQLGLESAVRYCEKPSDRDLRVLYDGARALVAPGLIEGYCLPALEAGARGTAVVASQSIPVREFLYDAVMSFDPSDAQQMASTFAIIWSNQGLRDKLGQKARSYALRRDWDMVAEDTLSVYRVAMAKHSEGIA